LLHYIFLSKTGAQHRHNSHSVSLTLSLAHRHT
jgi:hypothetical protein